MPLKFLLLRAVHDNVHTFSMKLNYSEPKIYTGGVSISNWSKLSKKQKQESLDKPWYIYYSFRNPSSGKLERQPNIKAGANTYKTKRERFAFLKNMQQAMLQLLQYGFNPYKDNTALEEAFFSKNSELKAIEAKEERTPPKPVEKTPSNDSQTKSSQISMPIKKAFEFSLDLKKEMMNPNSFVQYKSRILSFEKWLKTKGYRNKSILEIDKKLVIEYLNTVLKRSSARNRNNSRTDIASMFQLLEDNEIIDNNFVRKIPVIKSVPKRNKTYSPKQEKDIYNYLEQQDPHLLLFIKFISYSILRPIEICRLRVEDVDLEDKKLYVKAKNKPVQIKIIPEILLKELPNLSDRNPKSFLFGRFEISVDWNAKETNKRNEFSKRFKTVKDHFKLGDEYGMYSFKHTFITKLYRNLRKEMSQHEAKSNLLLITGHSTMSALEKYLRDIDAELPNDYSKLLV